MTARPELETRLGLGVGLDMPWSRSGHGFRLDPERGEGIGEPLARFFDRHRNDFHYTFVAFQPKGRRRLRASEYFKAYDAFFAAAEGERRKARAFHHTLLNLGTTEAYEHDKVVDFTNQLIERYGFRWVVEDIGIWSLRGKSLPYPLPPFLTQEGLDACVRNVERVQRRLAAPLSVEFPGFTDGSAFTIGSLDAFDFFAEVAQRSGCFVTIDIGHIISYQWLRGRAGSDHYEDFMRLPLSRCRELHLSGCRIVGGKFRDLHHGILLDEQIEVLEILLSNCPHLEAVTYEDPRFTADGVLVPRAQHNYARLKAAVERWAEAA